MDDGLESVAFLLLLPKKKKPSGLAAGHILKTIRVNMVSRRLSVLVNRILRFSLSPYSYV